MRARGHTHTHMAASSAAASTGSAGWALNLEERRRRRGGGEERQGVGVRLGEERVGCGRLGGGGEGWVVVGREVSRQ